MCKLLELVVVLLVAFLAVSGAAIAYIVIKCSQD